MKLSLAAALAHRPQLLILDEATAGLDPVVRDEILDEFLNFICDEDHAILISSHITSDLEKAADYITYLHQGRVVLSQPKDELLDRYGRVGCSTGDLAAIEPGDLLRVRRGTFGCEGLTSDRDVFQKKYPGLTVDPASLEDIMLLIGKGSPYVRTDLEGFSCAAKDSAAVCAVPAGLSGDGPAGDLRPHLCHHLLRGNPDDPAHLRLLL